MGFFTSLMGFPKIIRTGLNKVQIPDQSLVISLELDDLVGKAHQFLLTLAASHTTHDQEAYQINRNNESIPLPLKRLTISSVAFLTFLLLHLACCPPLALEVRVGLAGPTVVAPE
jgi:hypothetical protein